MIFKKQYWGILLIMVLLLSCTMSPEEARKELVELGVNYNADSFLKAVENEDYVVAEYFLIAGMSDGIHSAFIEGLDNDDYRMCKLLYDYNSEAVEKSMEQLDHMLHVCITNGYQKSIDFLIDHDFNFNKKFSCPDWKSEGMLGYKQKEVDYIPIIAAIEHQKFNIAEKLVLEGNAAGYSHWGYTVKHEDGTVDSVSYADHFPFLKDSKLY